MQKESKSRLHDLNRRERERADLLELARFRATELERPTSSPAKMKRSRKSEPC